MTDHRAIVARGFRIGGWLLGLPSLLGLLAIGALRLFADTSAKTDYLDIGTYGITGLLHNGAKLFGDILAGFGQIAAWLEAVAAAILAGVLVLAVMAYLTGRGIARHAAGARWVGIGLSVLFGVFWLTVLLSTSRNAMAVPAVGLAMSGYAVWVLGWR